MAREIKYFQGTGSGTYYTVPSGRTAKITLNYVSTGFDNLYVAGIPAVPSGVTIGLGIPAASTSSSLISPGDNQVVGTSGGSTLYVVTNVWYVGAGTTVSSPGVTAYSFLVIEEY